MSSHNIKKTGKSKKSYHQFLNFNIRIMLKFLNKLDSKSKLWAYSLSYFFFIKSNMLNLMPKKRNIYIFSFCFIWGLFLGMIQAGETPSVEGTRVYFINLKDGQTVKSPFLIQFGLTSQMGIAPALADWPDTGHHHLIIDATTPKPNKAISNKHIHLNLGQTEYMLELPAGEHTLQSVFGDYTHVPHDPPVMSKVITIKVE